MLIKYANNYIINLSFRLHVTDEKPWKRMNSFYFLNLVILAVYTFIKGSVWIKGFKVPQNQKTNIIESISETRDFILNTYYKYLMLTRKYIVHTRNSL